MSYSFQDCILFLIKKYPHTIASQWKCNSVFQDNNGEVYQLFFYDKNLSVILWENKHNLIEVDNINDKYDMDNNKYDMDNNKYEITKDLDGILSNNKPKHLFFNQIYINDNIIQENQFLQTLQVGLNIKTLEGSVSASKKINFNDFAKKCAIQQINLMQKYFDYLFEFLEIYENVSLEFMESFIINQNNEESLLELLSLLLKIENGYIIHNIPIKLNKEKIYIILTKIINVKTNINSNFNSEEHNISIFNELIDLFIEEITKYSKHVSDN